MPPKNTTPAKKGEKKRVPSGSPEHDTARSGQAPAQPQSGHAATQSHTGHHATASLPVRGVPGRTTSPTTSRTAPSRFATHPVPSASGSKPSYSIGGRNILGSPSPGPPAQSVSHPGASNKTTHPPAPITTTHPPAPITATHPPAQGGKAQALPTAACGVDTLGRSNTSKAKATSGFGNLLNPTFPPPRASGQQPIAHQAHPQHDYYQSQAGPYDSPSPPRGVSTLPKSAQQGSRSSATHFAHPSHPDHPDHPDHGREGRPVRAGYNPNVREEDSPPPFRSTLLPSQQASRSTATQAHAGLGQASSQQSSYQHAPHSGASTIPGLVKGLVWWCCECLRLLREGTTYHLYPSPFTVCRHKTKTAKGQPSRPCTHTYCDACVLQGPDDPRPTLPSKMKEVPWKRGPWTYKEYRDKNPSHTNPGFYCCHCYKAGNKDYNEIRTTEYCGNPSSKGGCIHRACKECQTTPWPI